MEREDFINSIKQKISYEKNMNYYYEYNCALKEINEFKANNPIFGNCCWTSHWYTVISYMHL